MRRAALACAAAAIGAGGLAGEVLLVSSASLAVGFGRASAMTLAWYVASYALGSWLTGRREMPPRRLLAWLAVPLALVAWFGVRALLGRAAEGASLVSSLAIAAAWIGMLGALQGSAFVALLRAGADGSPTRGFGVWFAANLAGAWLGAYLIGDLALARLGRSDAAALAGAAAACGALIGAIALAPSAASSAAPTVARAQLSRRDVALLAGLGTAWTIAIEWIGLRHALLWLESQQSTLTMVLAASLAALALGAAVSRWIPAGPRGVLALVGLAVLGTAWVAFGAASAKAIAGDSRFGFAFALLAPALLPLGAWLPCLMRSDEGEVGARAGRLFAQEAWGALLGAGAAHFLLVPRLGLGGALAALCALGFAIAVWLAREPRARGLGAAVAVVGLVASVGLALAPQPALRSPLYVDPALRVQSFAEDEEFAVGVVDDGLIGERTLLTDRFRAAGTGRDYLYMRALGHLPVLLHPAPRRVAVLCLGTGTTLGAVYLHPEVESIDVLEISRRVVDAAPWFLSVNQGALEPAASGRVRVRVGDGRRSLARSPGEFDVVTMEPLLPDSPFGVYLYTREFYRVVERSLRPGGLVCQWVPPHALEPKVFDAVVESFASAFPWTARFQFGTQLLLVGARAAPQLDPRRFEGVDAALGQALQSVQLSQPGGVIAAFRGAGAWPAAERALTDDEPWIVFGDKPNDARVFGWLASNLARVEQHVTPLPSPWTAVADAEAAQRAGDRLAKARLEFAKREAALRIGRAPDDAASAALSALAATPGAGAQAQALIEEQAFLEHLRQGVAAIEQDPERARDALISACELRPERGDVWLYLAAAHRRAGDAKRAADALARALEYCPRILETPAGRRSARWLAE